MESVHLWLNQYIQHLRRSIWKNNYIELTLSHVVLHGLQFSDRFRGHDRSQPEYSKLVLFNVDGVFHFDALFFDSSWYPCVIGVYCGWDMIGLYVLRFLKRIYGSRFWSSLLWCGFLLVSVSFIVAAPADYLLSLRQEMLNQEWKTLLFDHSDRILRRDDHISFSISGFIWIFKKWLIIRAWFYLMTSVMQSIRCGTISS